MKDILSGVNRRQALGLGAAAAALTVSACADSNTASDTPAPIKAKELTLNFEDNVWNREAYARLSGHTDPEKQKWTPVERGTYDLQQKRASGELVIEAIE